jgi:hypothetical protein
LGTVVLFPKIVDVEGAELAQEFLVHVDVFAVGVSQEDRFAEVGLQGVHLLDICAFGAASPPAQQA